MSAKRLGRFTAGLFVALGLALGGAVAATAGDNSTDVIAADAASVGSVLQQLDVEWH